MLQPPSHGRPGCPRAQGRLRRSTPSSDGTRSPERRLRSSPTRGPARPLGEHVVGDSDLRRIAHCVELDGVQVVNFHIDGDRGQFDRVVALAGERSILAGDSNLRGPAADGFSPPLAGCADQILVRGMSLVRGPIAWPAARRTVAGRLLSDHAPVEAVVD